MSALIPPFTHETAIAKVRRRKMRGTAEIHSGYHSATPRIAAGGTERSSSMGAPKS